MAHFISRDVTAVAVQRIHTGLNYKHATFTLKETASGSTTIAMAVLPPGARVVDATLAFDNDALGIVASPGTSVTLVRTGGTTHATVIQSATVSTVIQVYNPTYESVGYRVSSSSNVVISLTNMPASGSTTTLISLALVYDCQLDGD